MKRFSDPVFMGAMADMFGGGSALRIPIEVMPWLAAFMLRLRSLSGC